MKLLGYVSDERFTAIADASIELISDEDVFILRSTPSGALYGDLPVGRYCATLAAPGFGSKRCDITLDERSTPHQFRLMAEHMYGYVWPKWSRAGETASLRVHSPEPYRLSLAGARRVASSHRPSPVSITFSPRAKTADSSRFPGWLLQQCRLANWQ